MTGRKISGIVLFVGGVALLVVSLSADFMGIGTAPGIGGDQLIAAAIGVIAGVASVFAAMASSPLSPASAMAPLGSPAVIFLVSQLGSVVLFAIPNKHGLPQTGTGCDDSDVAHSCWLRAFV